MIQTIPVIRKVVQIVGIRPTILVNGTTIRYPGTSIRPLNI